MSAWSVRPVLGALYAHRPHRLFPDALYRVVSVGATGVVLRPVTHPGVIIWEDAEHFTAHFRQVDPGDEPTDDLMALAEAVGVARVRERRAGEQPLNEFTAGPTAYGPLWSDANLHREFFGGEPA